MSVEKLLSCDVFSKKRWCWENAAETEPVKPDECPTYGSESPWRRALLTAGRLMVHNWKQQIIQLLNMHIAQNLSKPSQLDCLNSEKTAAFDLFCTENMSQSCHLKHIWTVECSPKTETTGMCWGCCVLLYTHIQAKPQLYHTPVI